VFGESKCENWPIRGVFSGILSDDSEPSNKPKGSTGRNLAVSAVDLGGINVEI